MFQCKYCHTSFSGNTRNNIFCTQTCSNKHTAHHRYEKNSIVFLCDECGIEKKQKLSVFNRGSKHFCSPKCANRNKGRLIIGSNHPMWKGGVTDKLHKLRATQEYKKWRLAVYKRDRWTCQICFIKCSKEVIIAHHLKPFKDYKELRYTVSNGQTLCRGCHKVTHKEIGLATRFQSKENSL